MIVRHCFVRLLAGDVADRFAPYDRQKPLVNSDVRSVTDRVIAYGKWCPDVSYVAVLHEFTRTT